MCFRTDGENVLGVKNLESQENDEVKRHNNEFDFSICVKSNERDGKRSPL